MTNLKRARPLLAASMLVLLASCSTGPAYDLVVRDGTIYDGSGKPGIRGDIAVRGDRIAYVGPRAPGAARVVVEPHQYATGVSHVIVNGQIALADGEPTDARPGRFVRGRGWTGWHDGGCRSSAADWKRP